MSAITKNLVTCDTGRSESKRRAMWSGLRERLESQKSSELPELVVQWARGDLSRHPGSSLLGRDSGRADRAAGDLPNYLDPREMLAAEL